MSKSDKLRRKTVNIINFIFETIKQLDDVSTKASAEIANNTAKADELLEKADMIYAENRELANVIEDNNRIADKFRNLLN